METLTNSSGISRRSFLGISGAAALGVAGISSLTACSPTKQANENVGGASSNADPIEGVAAPQSWDEEADIVVVGTGGGLVAAAYAAAAGKKVVVLEKSSTWGGSSKETDIFSVMGSQTQSAIYQALAQQMAAAGQVEAAAQFGQLGSLDPQMLRAQWMQTYFTRPNGGDTGELPDGTEGPRACAPVSPLLETLVQCIPDAIGFMGKCGVAWGPVTEFGSAGYVSGLCPQGSEAGGIVARANYIAFESIYDFCVDNGVVFHFTTPAKALVAENGAVVGVQSEGEVSFVKANDGVILATGGV